MPRSILLGAHPRGPSEQKSSTPTVCIPGGTSSYQNGTYLPEAEIDDKSATMSTPLNGYSSEASVNEGLQPATPVHRSATLNRMLQPPFVGARKATNRPSSDGMPESMLYVVQQSDSIAMGTEDGVH